MSQTVTASRVEPDVRVRYLAWTLTGAAVLLVCLGVLLVLGRQPVVVIVAAVPVVIRVATAAADLHMLLFGHRPPPPRLPTPAAVPALAATAVVYPVIVHGDDDVTELIDSMRESRAAAGGGFAVHVALVDFADADTAVCDTDAGLRAAIEAGIAGLNTERGTPWAAVLFRERRWSPNQGGYLGWERKRGKLAELVDVIAGRLDTSYDLTLAQDLLLQLRSVRYLLTLDVGNRLTPKAARRLVATIAHPDNVAEVDPVTGVVVRGFGVVRPSQVPASPSTLFEWALNPYPVPDDLPLPAQAAFGRDTFLGQGVIDVAAYRAVLSGGRIPADRVLSHDKLEGMHLRPAAIADARVTESNVGDYLQFRNREHRWIRGDTHLVPWVFASRLPVADRWEMVRDVAHALYPVAVVTLFALGWLVPGVPVGWWTVVVLLLVAHPVALMALVPLVSAAQVAHRTGSLLVLLRRNLRPAGRLAVLEAARTLIWLPLLADRALIAVDAVVRAACRTVSRRHVLRWTSAATAGRVGAGFAVRLRRLWPSSLFSVMLAVGVFVVAGPVHLAWAAVLLLLWFAAPVWAYRAARPLRR